MIEYKPAATIPTSLKTVGLTIEQVPPGAMFRYDGNRYIRVRDRSGLNALDLHNGLLCQMPNVTVVEMFVR